MRCRCFSRKSSAAIVQPEQPVRQAGACGPQLWGLLTIALLFVTGCDAPPQPNAPQRTEREKAEESAEELHAAIWDRLALMPAVARNKFHYQRPISDLTREMELIESLRQQALNRGIHPDFAETVIRGQIEASKRIQERLHAEWTAQSPPKDVPLRDLLQELRPAIDQTTERLLIALQRLGSVPNEFESAIEQVYARRSTLPPHVPVEAWDMAWAPLREAPRDFFPGAKALSRIPSLKSKQPENQPLLPEFVPE